MALLEVIAYAVPVVASAVGGAPNIIEHGKTGAPCFPWKRWRSQQRCFSSE